MQLDKQKVFCVQGPRTEHYEFYFSLINYYNINKNQHSVKNHVAQIPNQVFTGIKTKNHKNN